MLVVKPSQRADISSPSQQDLYSCGLLCSVSKYGTEHVDRNYISARFTRYRLATIGRFQAKGYYGDSE